MEKTKLSHLIYASSGGNTSQHFLVYISHPVKYDCIAWSTVIDLLSLGSTNCIKYYVVQFWKFFKFLFYFYKLLKVNWE